MKSIRTKNIFLGVGIFIAFIFLQIFIAYKFHSINDNIKLLQNNSNLTNKLYSIYSNVLEYKYTNDKKYLLKIKEISNKLPQVYRFQINEKVSAKDFTALKRFLKFNINKIKNQNSSANIDVTYENIVMFIIILIINIIINIALYLFAKQIINNIEILQNGVKSFFDFLNRKTDTTQKIEVKTQDEFKDISDMINKNIETIKVNIQKDIKTVEEIRIVTTKMASGDFSYLITNNPANPEIKELKESLNSFLRTIKKTFDSILEVLNEYKNEDYTRRLNIDAKGEIKELIIGVNSLGYALEVGAVAIAKSLTNKSNSLKETSTKLTNNIDTLSDVLTNTSKNIDIVSEKTSNITENIKNTVDKINKMKLISDETKNEALKGEKLAIDTLESMQEIAESTNAIQEAITIIDSIAFQTNILSLNAAVEAATAGDAGKGFAVVAGEVRNLANRSASAAKKIKELVNKTKQKASEGIDISDDMKDNFLKVADKITTTSSYVDEITTGANVERQAIEDINYSLQKVHQNTENSKEIMQEAYVVSYDLKKISDELYEEVNKANNG